MHLPEQVKVGRKVALLDWKKIDGELTKKISKVYKEIRGTSGKSIRVSINEIIRRIDYKKWIDKRHRKLPKTTRLIDEQLESLEDFMIRKLVPAEMYYIKKKQDPKREQLIRRASINNSTTHNSPKVQKAVDDSLNRIKESIIRKK